MGGSAGASDSDSRTQIDPNQLPYLRQLWGAGNRLWQGEQSPEAIQGASQGLVNQVMPGAQAGAETLTGLAQGQTAGQQQLAANMTEESPWLGQQIANFGADIRRNLSENILPELRSGGIAAGAPGGSRAQIASGLAAQGAQREFSQGATQLRAADILRQQEAARALTSSQGAGAQGAVMSAPQLYNLGFSPYQAAWMPLQMQRGLLGTPVINQRSDSDAWEFGFTF